MGEEERKLRDFCDAFLVQKAIESAGLAPATKNLIIINSLNTHREVAAAMGRPDVGFASPLGISITIDFKNTNRYAVIVTQSGLPMDRDYYLKDDQNVAKIREEYRNHLSRMFLLAG